jgi:hypothetical protein
MQQERLLKYIDTNSKDYVRAYANTTLATISPYYDVVIDFCEETLKPFLVVERPIEDYESDDIVFSHSINEVLVEREKKFSVTMNKKQALMLADWIIENCREENDLGDDRY